ncbi:hypothetical protein BJV82DRAFT_542310 [Fennellomyces sp. T-0311]|nr:hypothetical protein BJV82DRAFT_542310 [Fennellomyces sp. T-0311]
MYLSWRRQTWPTLLLLLVFAIGGRSSPLCVEHHHSHAAPIRHAIRTCPERSVERRAAPASEMLVIDFACIGSSDADCNKVASLLAKAGGYITSVLAFKTPVHVNASYLSFCKDLGQCTKRDGTIGTGQAYPAVSYLMQEGEATRMYPQALLKQYKNLPSDVDWYSYDMNAQFNSEIKWYFEDDSKPIAKDETDLLNTIIHELIHGLGFVSAWSDDTYERFSRYDPRAKKFLTPMPLNPPNELPEVSESMESDSGVQPFWGFVEFPFDKYLHVNNVPLTDVTAALNKWGDGNVMFATIVDMVNAWDDDQVFRKRAEDVYRAATQRGGITLVIDNEAVLMMESSLDPFQDGSSLAHVDRTAYVNTDEFLMIYNAQRGVSLSDMMHVYKLGPLGPSLVQVMASMGYDIQPSYNATAITIQPNLTFWEPPMDLVGTASNPTPVVSVNADGPAHIPTESPSSSAPSHKPLPFLLSAITLFLCCSY